MQTLPDESASDGQTIPEVSSSGAEVAHSTSNIQNYIVVIKGSEETLAFQLSNTITIRILVDEFVKLLSVDLKFIKRIKNGNRIVNSDDLLSDMETNTFEFSLQDVTCILPDQSIVITYYDETFEKRMKLMILTRFHCVESQLEILMDDNPLDPDFKYGMHLDKVFWLDFLVSIENILLSFRASMTILEAKEIIQQDQSINSEDIDTIQIFQRNERLSDDEFLYKFSNLSVAIQNTKRMSSQIREIPSNSLLNDAECLVDVVYKRKTETILFNRKEALMNVKKKISDQFGLHGMLFDLIHVSDILMNEIPFNNFPNEKKQKVFVKPINQKILCYRFYNEQFDMKINIDLKFSKFADVKKQICANTFQFDAKHISIQISGENMPDDQYIGYCFDNFSSIKIMFEGDKYEFKLPSGEKKTLVMPYECLVKTAFDYFDPLFNTAICMGSKKENLSFHLNEKLLQFGNHFRVSQCYLMELPSGEPRFLKDSQICEIYRVYEKRLNAKIYLFHKDQILISDSTKRLSELNISKVDVIKTYYKATVTVVDEKGKEFLIYSYPKGNSSLIKLKKVIRKSYSDYKNFELIYNEKVVTNLNDFDEINNIITAVENIPIVINQQGSKDFTELRSPYATLQTIVENYPNYKLLNYDPEIQVRQVEIPRIINLQLKSKELAPVRISTPQLKIKPIKAEIRPRLVQSRILGFFRGKEIIFKYSNGEYEELYTNLIENYTFEQPEKFLKKIKSGEVIFLNQNKQRITEKTEVKSLGGQTIFVSIFRKYNIKNLEQTKTKRFDIYQKLSRVGQLFGLKHFNLFNQSGNQLWPCQLFEMLEENSTIVLEPLLAIQVILPDGTANEMCFSLSTIIDDVINAILKSFHLKFQQIVLFDEKGKIDSQKKLSYLNDQAIYVKYVFTIVEIGYERVSFVPLDEVETIENIKKRLFSRERVNIRCVGKLLKPDDTLKDVTTNLLTIYHFRGFKLNVIFNDERPTVNLVKSVDLNDSIETVVNEIADEYEIYSDFEVELDGILKANLETKFFVIDPHSTIDIICLDPPFTFIFDDGFDEFVFSYRFPLDYCVQDMINKIILTINETSKLYPKKELVLKYQGITLEPTRSIRDMVYKHIYVHLIDPLYHFDFYEDDMIIESLDCRIRDDSTVLQIKELLFDDTNLQLTFFENQNIYHIDDFYLTYIVELQDIDSFADFEPEITFSVRRGKRYKFLADGVPFYLHFDDEATFEDAKEKIYKECTDIDLPYIFLTLPSNNFAVLDNAKLITVPQLKTDVIIIRNYYRFLINQADKEPFEILLELKDNQSLGSVAQILKEEHDLDFDFKFFVGDYQFLSLSTLICELIPSEVVRVVCHKFKFHFKCDGTELNFFQQFDKKLSIREVTECLTKMAIKADFMASNSTMVLYDYYDKKIPLDKCLYDIDQRDMITIKITCPMYVFISDTCSFSLYIHDQVTVRDVKKILFGYFPDVFSEPYDEFQYNRIKLYVAYKLKDETKFGSLINREIRLKIEDNWIQIRCDDEIYRLAFAKPVSGFLLRHLLEKRKLITMPSKYYQLCYEGEKTSIQLDDMIYKPTKIIQIFEVAIFYYENKTFVRPINTETKFSFVKVSLFPNCSLKSVVIKDFFSNVIMEDDEYLWDFENEYTITVEKAKLSFQIKESSEKIEKFYEDQTLIKDVEKDLSENVYYRNIILLFNGCKLNEEETIDQMIKNNNYKDGDVIVVQPVDQMMKSVLKDLIANFI